VPQGPGGPSLACLPAVAVTVPVTVLECARSRCASGSDCRVSPGRRRKIQQLVLYILATNVHIHMLSDRSCRAQHPSTNSVRSPVHDAMVVGTGATPFFGALSIFSALTSRMCKRTCQINLLNHIRKKTQQGPEKKSCKPAHCEVEDFFYGT
jgi:hypothetical protein